MTKNCSCSTYKVDKLICLLQLRHLNLVEILLFKFSNFLIFFYYSVSEEDYPSRALLSSKLFLLHSLQLMMRKGEVAMQMSCENIP